MSHLSRLSAEDWRELEKIVDVCRRIQSKFAVVAELRENRLAYIKQLVDICRKCTDSECEKRDDCEVKKAYATLI
jgi:hypothetical protein